MIPLDLSLFGTDPWWLVLIKVVVLFVYVWQNFGFTFLLFIGGVSAIPKEVYEASSIDGVHDPNWVRFTYPFNLTRSPVGTVPIGRTADGVPVGLQVIGPQHADAAVLRVLAYLEGAIGVDDVAPVG